MAIHVVMEASEVLPPSDIVPGPAPAPAADVLIMELLMPVCSEHSGIRHKVPRSSPLHRDAGYIYQNETVLAS